METSVRGSDDSVLMATARAAREIGLLPGAPTRDWLARLSRILTEAASDTAVEAALVRLQPGGPEIECRGSAIGEQAGDEIRAAVGDLRHLVRPLAEQLADPGRPDVWRVPESADAEASTRLRRMAARRVGALAAWAPLARHRPPYGLILVWDGPAGQTRFEPCDRRRILRSLLPLIGERLRFALGGPGERARWLSRGEQRVLELLALGQSVPEIAEQLGRSQHTIHDYVKRLHRKLGTRSRGSLIARTLGGPAAQKPPAPVRVRPERPERPERPACTLAFRADGRISFVRCDGW